MLPTHVELHSGLCARLAVFDGFAAMVGAHSVALPAPRLHIAREHLHTLRYVPQGDAEAPQDAVDEMSALAMFGAWHQLVAQVQRTVL